MKQLILITLSACLLAACNNNDNAGANKQPDVVVVESAGKKLFINNCMQCHGLKTDCTGPALAGVLGRWKNDTTKLTAFIHNSQKVIAADGPDSYAGKLFDKWYKTSMPSFGGITDDEIKQIVGYADKGVE
ncbi:c-type cytochrome [Flavipsychrobacter stenotrophus]|nr:cytochrome c [Flavipsychrobacter stenotrophus]